jgi:hypothetical protein
MPADSATDDESFLCPHCGEEVAAGFDFCRQCGASAESGWNDDVLDFDEGYADDDEFDYDEFINREFPQHAAAQSKPSLWRLLFIALVVILCVSLLSFSLVGF